MKAVDREHRDADLLFQVWRAVTVRHPDEEGALASAKHEVEHEALAAMLALRAGVHAGAPVIATPSPRRSGGARARADRRARCSATRRPSELTDAVLAAIWSEVAVPAPRRASRTAS